ncbi:MAG TPA: dienelactone hydrolase family protein [Candidatus Saccharimonadales bacterium]|nr:dienelactone hydrolase family protein [Candidatus Saccharimonadales bacterium]
MMNEVKIPFDINPVPAYYAEPEIGSKHPAIILIHEIWGLNNHIKDIANRFMQQGYAVLVPDLLADTNISEKVSAEVFEIFKNPEKRDEVQTKMREVFAPVHSPEFATETIAKLQACFTYLQQKETIGDNISVVGFCFGGTYAYALAAEQPQLKAAVPFYGHAPSSEKIQMIACPVLAFYGGQDAELSSKLPELNETMALFHKKFQAVEYPDVAHAFFNDTNPDRYNKAAADDAWQRMLEFLKENMYAASE